MDVNSRNLLAFITEFFILIGCDPIEVKAFFTARKFPEGVVLNLPAVCLLPANKPATSKSKQYHIHVTSRSRDFFYPGVDMSAVAASTPWERQDLSISEANINYLLGITHDASLSVVNSHMMKKIERRQSQETQVQLSKKSDDDSKFLDLRKGLYENDVIVFLRNRTANRLFVVGIPKSFYNGKYTFETNRSVFKSAVYTALESKNALPVKKALESVLEEHVSNEVIESDEPISDAIYQSQVDAAEPSETDYSPKEYVEENPDGKATKSHRPPTNPAIGKEAIKDGAYECAINGGHITFIKPDGTKYMEAHHLIPMDMQSRFKNKLDTKANIVPLCPNCHRMLHHGRSEDIEPLLKMLFDDRNEKLQRSGIAITFDDLKGCY